MLQMKLKQKCNIKILENYSYRITILYLMIFYYVNEVCDPELISLNSQRSCYYS